MIKNPDGSYTGKWILAARRSSASGKTAVLDILTKERMPLGTVAWDGGWRRYVFAPLGMTIFEPTCLRDLAEILDDLMAERRKS